MNKKEAAAWLNVSEKTLERVGRAKLKTNYVD
jgi:hypothetical protein